MKSKLLLLSMIVTISIVLTGCGASDNNDATNNTPPAADNGVTTAANPETLYKQNCTSCHGVNLNQMKNADLTTVGSRLSKDEIATKIAKGGAGMIAFEQKLDANEIDALADWLEDRK
ncbi:MAG: cytochrome c [Paenibacillaceae bacterium]